MLRAIREAAELIKARRDDSIEIISHMDTDGVCAAAAISTALDRLGAEHRVRFVHMLYREVVEELEPADLTIFTDLGSSQLDSLKQRYAGEEAIIADHHEPAEAEGWPGLVHLNAHLYGLDGMQEISGSGIAYLIARELDASNKDLSALAVVGAIGDIQDAWGRLLGYNRRILRDGEESGVLKRGADLLLYGRHTRPIPRSLESLSDPPIPGITNCPAGCVSLLKDLNIPLRDGGRWRRPADLTDAEKRRLATELISRALAHVPGELAQYVPGLIIGESYVLLREEEGSMLRGADEFATCVSSTARQEQPLIGLEVAKGDRGAYYRAMLNLLRQHRRSIAEGMQLIKREGLMRAPRGYLQYFDATGVLKDTQIGAVASLALSLPAADPYKPIAGVAREGGAARISARCSKLLFLRGLDLGRAIRESASAVGGEGGGHAVACGAQVPEGKVPRFLEEFEARILRQLGAGPSRP